MPAQYRHNHYVPVWYQKRFLPPGQVDQELFYLDFVPRVFVDPRGVKHPINPVKQQGFKHCFAHDDLYTVTFGGMESTQLEQAFFGELDSNGRDAVEYWTGFDHRTAYQGEERPDDPFNNLMRYMSTQKLRTPKGLGWLTEQVRRRSGSDDKNLVLKAMIDLRSLHNAIWAECVWQIADADQSTTKFIVSDHPVTVYNRRCGPKSQWCRGNDDPDIWLHGTHTLFPLSLNKILILTNLSWVRNPYQSSVEPRPNPQPFRSTMFYMGKIQTLRHLSEEEVRQINFIIKSRALRYLGAAKEEWLYPERFVCKSDWNTYGGGLLLMPDPRAVAIGGTVMWGGGKAGPGALDEYGRPPWHKDFEKESKSHEESRTLYRFQGEFARLFGPQRRGVTTDFSDQLRERDSDKLHAYHLSLEEKVK